MIMWKYGNVEVSKYGSMRVWIMKVWKYESLEIWKYGNTEIRKYGSMEV